MTNAVSVRAPCRLHFGMFSFGHANVAQFGGIGMMVEPPNIEVRISPSDRFRVNGVLTERTSEFVRRLVDRWGYGTLPACEISVRSPQNHTGLGVGTQLGLSIAAGLRRFLRLPELPVDALAEAVGRGGRSAVGTHGFERGGLIVDGGKQAGEKLGKFVTRAHVPDRWRVVLFCPSGAHGLTGASEIAAFDRLPAVPNTISNELWSLATGAILPAVEKNDCIAFGEAVYQFGKIAGDCFSAVQSGPFASPDVAALVKSIRSFGVPGAGQSSWGPTVFGITANDDGANRLVESVCSKTPFENCETTIARPNNTGATIEVSPSD